MEMPVDWPELNDWCKGRMNTVGVDMATGADYSAILIMDNRRPDDVRWYQITQQEAAILYGRRPRHISGDVDQMISDIDGVELTPKTKLGRLCKQVEQRVYEELCGLAILQEMGKL